MNSAQQKKEIKRQEQKQLTTQWYNRNEQLYRTYLQNLYLRLRNIPQDKSNLTKLIDKYLQAEDLLLLISKPLQTKSEVEQSFQKIIESQNQQIEVNQKQLFALQREIDIKRQQKRLLTQLLKIKLENYSKVILTYNQTISQKQDSFAERQNREISFEVPNLEGNLNLTNINQSVQNSFQQAKQHKLKGGLYDLQVEKQKLAKDICQVIDKQALPQQLQQLYRQKESTLQQIKSTQQQITKYSNKIQTKQINYGQTVLLNKNLIQQINRLQLRTVDDLLTTNDQDQQRMGVNQQSELGRGPPTEQSDKKSNKRIAFTEQSPKKTRLRLVYWATVVALLWLIAFLA